MHDCGMVNPEFYNKQETSNHRKQEKLLTIKKCFFDDAHKVLVLTIQNDNNSFLMAKIVIFDTFSEVLILCLQP